MKKLIIFFLLLIPLVYGASTTHDYDFVGIEYPTTTYNATYGGLCTFPVFPTPITGMTEFNPTDAGRLDGGNYSGIAYVSDDINASYGIVGLDCYALHLFTFTFDWEYIEQIGVVTKAGGQGFGGTGVWLIYLNNTDNWNALVKTNYGVNNIGYLIDNNVNLNAISNNKITIGLIANVTSIGPFSSIILTDYVQLLLAVGNNSPYYTNLSNNVTNNTYSGDDVQFNITAWDDYGLSHIIFSWNDSGTWVNDSPMILYGRNQTVQINKTITATYPNNICGRFFINDTDNKNNLSSVSCFNLNETIFPPEDIILKLEKPLNDSNQTGAPFSLDHKYYVNKTGLNCSLYINDTWNQSHISNAGNNTFWIPYGFNQTKDVLYNVSCLNASPIDPPVNWIYHLNVTGYAPIIDWVNISLLWPFNNSNVTDTTLNHTYYVNDSGLNCSLYINDTYNQSHSTSLGNNTFHINYSINLEIDVLWNVSCTGMTPINYPTNWIYHLNTSVPPVPPPADNNFSVNFTRPLNATPLFSFINVSWRYGNETPPVNCSLWLIHENIGFRELIVQNHSQNWTLIDLRNYAPANYSFNISCFDSVSYASDITPIFELKDVTGFELGVIGFISSMIIMFLILTIKSELAIFKAAFFMLLFSFITIGLNILKLFLDQNNVGVNIIKNVTFSYQAIIFIMLTFAFLFFIYGLYLLFLYSKDLLTSKRNIRFDLR